MDKDKYLEIVQKIEKKLLTIEEIESCKISCYEKCTNFIRKELKVIRKEILEEGFKNQNEEIYFFKQIKPKIVAWLIYYIELYKVEIKKPQVNDDLQKEFYRKLITQFQTYFADNRDFYSYFRGNANFSDKQYFLRNKKTVKINSDCFNSYLDDEFSTNKDVAIAKFLGYNLLIKKLEKEKFKIENKKKQNQGLFNKSNLKWTGNKVDLVELIYALNTLGVINNGNADIKELALKFQSFFNTEVGDFYRTYTEIRSRKMNSTKFIDMLKDALLKRMEEIDS